LESNIGWLIFGFIPTDQVFNPSPDQPSSLVLLIKGILGILLIAIAE
jgi:hypothetical protein